MKKAILYINQFFGQIGGEDQADFGHKRRKDRSGAGVRKNTTCGNYTYYYLRR